MARDGMPIKRLGTAGKMTVCMAWRLSQRFFQLVWGTHSFVRFCIRLGDLTYSRIWCLALDGLFMFGQRSLFTT